MKNLIIASLCLAAACAALRGFTDAECSVIVAGKGGIMRLWTVADRDDSLFLRRKAAVLGREELGSAGFRMLKEGMLATVRDTTNRGVGIAAPQVGVSRRLIAVQRFDEPGEPFGFYANPEIVYYSRTCRPGPEGCLSVPDVSGSVLRSDTIVVRYTDEASLHTVTDTVVGFTAVIFQHEVDHLDGVLFTDRMQE